MKYGEGLQTDHFLVNFLKKNPEIFELAMANKDVANFIRGFFLKLALTYERPDKVKISNMRVCNDVITAEVDYEL